MKGKVTPVMGKSPVTTPIFNDVWNNKEKPNPNIKYLPNRSFVLIALLNTL